jgi:hypothetical protein
MHTGWYALDPAALPRGVVVADASPAAAALWDGPIASILEELADRLPADARPGVVFLGGRDRHPLGGVLRGLGSGHPAADGPGVGIAANLGRHPAAGPVLRDLLDGPPRPVLFLLNGPTLDLDDWAVPEVTSRTLVYRLTGTGRVSPAGFAELGPAADLGDLVAHLADPVRSVRLDGFALDWDNDAYRWADGELAADGPAAVPVRVRLAVADGATPGAVVTRTGGAEHRLALTPGTAPADPAEVPLTAAEGLILDQWERGNGFYCGACRRPHPPGRVRCDPGGGPGLLPTAAGLAASLVVAARRSGGWAVTPVSRGVLPLPDGRVLARRPGAAGCYGLDAGRWVPFDDPGDWLPLGDGAFAVAG